MLLLKLLKIIYFSNEEFKNDFGNIFVYFSSSACSKYYYFLKSVWYKEQGSPVLFDTLLNYFKDKFTFFEGQEEELINIVQYYSDGY